MVNLGELGVSVRIEPDRGNPLVPSKEMNDSSPISRFVKLPKVEGCVTGLKILFLDPLPIAIVCKCDVVRPVFSALPFDKGRFLIKVIVNPDLR